MKNKILTFIIGVLVGAIIATAGFYIYAKSNSSDNDMLKGDMSSEQRGQDNDGTTPPDMPNSDSNSIPEKPSGEQNDTIANQ